MTAKAPHAYPAYANGNKAHPSSSVGTTAVNRNSYEGHPLGHHLSHTGPSGNGSLEPSASSFSPQDPYAPSSFSHNQNHPLPPPDDSYGQTTFNTQANTQTGPFQDHDRLYAPVATRPTGKFTEEWDASQRGSSIVNGPIPQPNNMSSIHRSNSFSGSTTGAGGGFMDGSSIQMSRSNTLKKKSSLRRRSGSLRRAGSRRSMKAGSVRSLALQSNADEDELHSAFFCPVPTTGNPTEALANRFQGKWHLRTRPSTKPIVGFV